MIASKKVFRLTILLLKLGFTRVKVFKDMNSNLRFQGHSLNICVNHNALANRCGKGKNFTFRFDNLRCICGKNIPFIGMTAVFDFLLLASYHEHDLNKRSIGLGPF